MKQKSKKIIISLGIGVLGLILFFFGMYMWRWSWDSTIIFPYIWFFGIVAIMLIGLVIIIREIIKWVKI